MADPRAFSCEDTLKNGLAVTTRHLRPDDRERMARDHGIAEFEVDVLAENTPMLVVFAKAGLPMRKRNDGGTVHVTVSLRAGEI